MTEFNIIADSNITLTEDAIDSVLSVLKKFSPSIGTSEGGTSQLIATVDAMSFTSATALAYDIATAAFFGHDKLESLTVMNTDWFDGVWSRG